jgi:MFS family permease
VARSARHRAPIVELSLLRVRDFGAATVATLVFAVTFATLILASLLWTQQVWGYSALRAGLALAPGPLMVPLLAVGAGPVAALGSLVISAGLVTLSLSAGTTPSYLTEMLPGTVITGIGVGLALPTLVAAGAATLPAHRFATGSGVLNMARQLGAVLGVAILVSILGAPATPDAAVSAFQHAWFVAAAIGVVAAVAAVRLGRPSATAPAGAEPTDVRHAPSY